MKTFFPLGSTRVVGTAAAIAVASLGLAACGGGSDAGPPAGSTAASRQAAEFNANDEACLQNVSYRCTRLTVHNDVPDRVMWVVADNRELPGQNVRIPPGQARSVTAYNGNSSFQMGARVTLCTHAQNEYGASECPRRGTVDLTGVELCNPGVGRPSAYVTPHPALQVPCRGDTFGESVGRTFPTAWNWLEAVLWRQNDSVYFKEWNLRVKPRPSAAAEAPPAPAASTVEER